MSRGFNPWPVWSQVPVANRLVEVNTKTGFSLTAGSYVVRASSTQRGTITNAAASGSNTATVSSVTTTRAHALPAGCSFDVATGIGSALARVTLTNATTVTATRDATADVSIAGYAVLELF